MKLKYLGTAAAEGVPALFCECDTCQEAILKGGRNIRTRSQAIVDDFILVDFPADSYFHMITNKLQFSKFQHLIITHSHPDHLYPADFEMRSVGYAHFNEEKPLNIYANGSSFNQIKVVMEKYKLEKTNRIIMHEIIPNRPFLIEGYELLPLNANHSPASSPVMYLISHKNKIMLYAQDTGYFYDDVFEQLIKIKKPLDLISLDCTAGLLSNWRDGHMSLDTNVELLNQLKGLNVIDENTKVIINHFSHNCLANYNKMQEAADDYGIIVSYDGMEIEF